MEDSETKSGWRTSSQADVRLNGTTLSNSDARQLAYVPEIESLAHLHCADSPLRQPALPPENFQCRVNLLIDARSQLAGFHIDIDLRRDTRSIERLAAGSVPSKDRKPQPVTAAEQPYKVVGKPKSDKRTSGYVYQLSPVSPAEYTRRPGRVSIKDLTDPNASSLFFYGHSEGRVIQVGMESRETGCCMEKGR